MFPKIEKKDYMRIFLLALLVFILISPPMLNLATQKMYYEAGTMVITQPPVMEITSGDDIFYGQNTFSAVLVFYNMEYVNYSFENQIEEQFERANINITFTRVWVNETPRVYTDVEFMEKMDTIKTDYSADFISVFANMRPNEDEYPRLIGFANIYYHFSIVFCPKLPSPVDWGAVQTHEIGHLMGLNHVDDPYCLMYKEYLYTNRYFCYYSISKLEALHG